MKLIKSAEHREIFQLTQTNNVKHWIENWDTFIALGRDINNVEIISFNELKSYKVGDTLKVTTVTKIIKGKAPKELFYPDESEVPVRRWAIAGTTMDRPDWYDALGEMKFTHIYHNRACPMDMERLDRMGIKVIINYTGESKSEWIDTYKEWNDKPVCGGSWLDDAGHEPDITRKGESYGNWNHRLEVRERFYQFIRGRDSDVFNKPVVEMMDNTATGDFPNEHPGWGLAYSGKTHNLLLPDIYPNYPNAAKMIAAMNRSWNKFIKVYPREHQVIIQICAYGNSYWPGYIRTQYDFWKEKMASLEFENPYRGPIGMCYYKQETIMQNEELQNEIREVNKEIIRR